MPETYRQERRVSHANGHLIIARAKNENMGFITDTELEGIASDVTTRLTPVLVRCGGGRFRCPAQDAAHFIKIIESTGKDYVRDVAVL